MPNIQTVLRAEISRLARKELRGEISSLRKLVAQHRSHIASLRREVQGLQTKLRAVSKSGGRLPEPAAPDDASAKLRFRAGGFATLRQKLGLSAKEMGDLIGVSALSVYKWEKGQAHPRAKQLQAIAAVRGLGKREAAARLDALKSAKTRPRRSRA
jgi:DNA-binding XRE family transcriptional regulator